MIETGLIVQNKNDKEKLLINYNHNVIPRAINQSIDSQY
jgi:hypothetical protein